MPLIIRASQAVVHREKMLRYMVPVTCTGRCRRSFLDNGTAPIFMVVLLVALLPASNPTSGLIINITGPADLEAAVAQTHAHTTPGILALEIYAPWCGYCKKLEPHWKEAARRLAEEGKAGLFVRLAQADATLKGNTQLHANFGIKGYPTILIFRDGDLHHPIRYNGPRDANGIVKYFNERAVQSPCQYLRSNAQLEAFPHQSAVIAFIPSTSTMMSAHIDALQSMGRQLLWIGDGLSISCGYVTDPSLIASQLRHHGRDESESDSPVAILYDGKGNNISTYTGAFDPSLLTSWAASRFTPLVAVWHDIKHVGGDFYKSYSVPLPRVIVAVDSEKDVDLARPEIEAAARANDDLKFFLTSKLTGKKLLNNVLFTPPSQPPLIFIIEEPKANKRYLKSGMKLEELPEFLEEYRVGALTPFIRSESKSEVKNLERSKGPIIDVTASSYDAQVRNSKKHVFINIYIPNAQDSKLLRKKWEALGASFADHPNVTIARMDASNNDLPDERLVVYGYPTLYWISASSTHTASTPIKYMGLRELDDLKVFVSKRLNMIEYPSHLHEEL